MARYQIDEQEFRDEGPEGSLGNLAPGEFTGPDLAGGPKGEGLLSSTPYEGPMSGEAHGTGYTPRENFGGEDTLYGQGTSYTPRENFPAESTTAALPNVTSTPRKPDVPTPMAGTVSTVNRDEVGDSTDMSMPTSVVRMRPVSGPIGTPGAGRPALFGSLGGLKGGGLGVPSITYTPHQRDTTSIDRLIAALVRQKNRLF